jgi:hypothetical protein
VGKGLAQGLAAEKCPLFCSLSWLQNLTAKYPSIGSLLVCQPGAFYLKEKEVSVEREMGNQWLSRLPFLSNLSGPLPERSKPCFLFADGPDRCFG